MSLNDRRDELAEAGEIDSGHAVSEGMWTALHAKCKCLDLSPLFDASPLIDTWKELSINLKCGNGFYLVAARPGHGAGFACCSSDRERAKVGQPKSCAASPQSTKRCESFMRESSFSSQVSNSWQRLGQEDDPGSKNATSACQQQTLVRAAVKDRCGKQDRGCERDRGDRPNTAQVLKNKATGPLANTSPDRKEMTQSATASPLRLASTSPDCNYRARSLTTSPQHHDLNGRGTKSRHYHHHHHENKFSAEALKVAQAKKELKRARMKEMRQEVVKAESSAWARRFESQNHKKEAASRMVRLMRGDVSATKAAGGGLCSTTIFSA